ncbi:hypothetical protein QBC34DRAFT_459627 [Podospora aff. communis PSN243]|uniref:Uncharacterized protein n=1 Tax=Podospora aff. communis PSN243 TaxID=3040156 RepID=A0AAV9GTS2_9PEZI|nr:hypothetical protein QBC34DRAFT_459627 [Podospora aff. communis PSN243]
MAFAMDAVSATARFLGDPPAGQRGSTSVTKREAIVIVTATATMYFFWPERLWIFKSIFNIVFLGWVTALAFDAKDAGVEAWDGIPSWLKSYLGASGGGVAGASAQARRVWAPKEESPGQIVMLQLQQVIKNIKAAPLTQDVWELIRTLLVRCLRMALHYLENTHGTSSHAPTAQRDVHHKTASTQSYAILIRTQPVHGYGSFGPSQPLWDDFPMEMDPWDNPEPSALPVSWQSTSTSCIPPLTESLTADTHFSLCIVDKDIWESGSTTLFTKLASGRYWDIRGQDEWQRGEKWSESNVKQIIGVEVLGLIQGQDPLDACNRHFDTLRWGWEYKNISWNDVDFAILLGALVVGPKATDKCGDLFQTMETLRLEQFLVPRAQLSAGFVTAVSAMAILGTGGLAAPFVGPMVLGKLGSGAKISRRDQAIWDQRMERGRELDRVRSILCISGYTGPT